MSAVPGKAGSLAIDGGELAMTPGAPYDYTAPADLAGGQHSITVTVTDLAARTATATVDVNVFARCGPGVSCAAGVCLGGYCQPDATTPGGVGTPCTSAGECITGTCAVTEEESICTGACDAGDACPDGFTCTPSSDGTRVCWPDESGGCGCSSNGTGSQALFGLLVGALVLRRRRRR